MEKCSLLIPIKVYLSFNKYFTIANYMILNTYLLLITQIYVIQANKIFVIIM